MINKTEGFYLFLAVLISAPFLVLGGTMDISMAEAFFARRSLLTVLVRLSFFPAFVFAWLEALLMTAYALHNHVFRAGKMTLFLYLTVGVIASVGLPVYGFYQLSQILKLETDYRIWIMVSSVALIAVFYAVRVIGLHDIYDERRAAERAFAGLLIFLAIWAATIILNSMSARAPFRDILNQEDYLGYTPWYRKGIATDGGCFPPFTVTMAFASGCGYYLVKGTSRTRRNALMLLASASGCFISVAAVLTGFAYPADCSMAFLLTLVAILCGGFGLRKVRPAASGQLFSVKTADTPE